MEAAKLKLSKTTPAQEALSLELEKNKKFKKTLSQAEKKTQHQKIFSLQEAKKKKKRRGAIEHKIIYVSLQVFVIELSAILEKDYLLSVNSVHPIF